MIETTVKCTCGEYTEMSGSFDLVKNDIDDMGEYCSCGKYVRVRVISQIEGKEETKKYETK